MPAKRKTAPKARAGTKPAQKASGTGDLTAVQVALASAIARAAPALEQTTKWGYDTWVGIGNVCSILPAKAHVNLQLFGGTDLPDPKKLLEGTGKGMRHVKCRSVADAKRPAVAALIRAAAKVDAAG